MFIVSFLQNYSIGYKNLWGVIYLIHPYIVSRIIIYITQFTFPKLVKANFG